MFEQEGEKMAGYIDSGAVKYREKLGMVNI